MVEYILISLAYAISFHIIYILKYSKENASEGNLIINKADLFTKSKYKYVIHTVFILAVSLLFPLILGVILAYNKSFSENIAFAFRRKVYE